MKIDSEGERVYGMINKTYGEEVIRNEYQNNDYRGYVFYNGKTGV